MPSQIVGLGSTFATQELRLHTLVAGETPDLAWNPTASCDLCAIRRQPGLRTSAEGDSHPEGVSVSQDSGRCVKLEHIEFRVDTTLFSRRGGSAWGRSTCWSGHGQGSGGEDAIAARNCSRSWAADQGGIFECEQGQIWG